MGIDLFYAQDDDDTADVDDDCDLLVRLFDFCSLTHKSSFAGNIKAAQ